MTCREFKQNAEALTLWELTRSGDEGLQQHAQQCEGCGVWLQEQRNLAASLQALQAHTAESAASPNVERALVQAFREYARIAAATRSVAGNDSGSWPVDLDHAPFVLRVSRWFEIGAYMAVAAAIAVGLFLGVRLLERNSKPAPVESHSSPVLGEAATPKQAAAAQPKSQIVTPQAANSNRVPMVKQQERIPPPATMASAAQQLNAPQESQADESGYVPLMFCDPLSCAADSQVVRMELTANPASQSSQPQLADVVVGYDGVVRAVRMVN